MFSHLPVKMSPQVILVRWWMKTLGDGSVEKNTKNHAALGSDDDGVHHQWKCSGTKRPK